jgi:two-component system, OmpR family, response regulator
MRILIIDDDESLRETLAASLREESFAVDLAADGTDGSYLARTNDYDLIILDSILPGKNGVEVCREVRLSGRNMPILSLSVEDDLAAKLCLLNNGADDYLTKPFSFQELMARIRAILRRPPVFLGEAVTVDNLTLDSRTQSVRRGEREIYLTRKEFLLLEYLMRNRGRVLSRGIIMEHVWDRQGDLFSNTIETHVLNLRRKLEKRGERKLIHTIPGRGYKLDDRELVKS